jgi:hypothetical protein
VLAGISYFHWHNSDESPNSITALMPDTASAVIFVSLKEFDQTPFFTKLNNWAPQSKLDPEYAQFLTATGFNYERDLDRLGIAILEQRTARTFFAVAEGKFNRKKIEAYALQHGSRKSNAGREFFTIHPNAGAGEMAFTFLSKNRIVLSNDQLFPRAIGERNNNAEAAEWRTRFDRLAGSPVFAVIRQNSEISAGLTARAPGGLRSPQLASLLNQLQWISIAGKPDNDRLRVVVDGESASDSTNRQLTDLCNGVLLLAKMGLNDARTREQLDPDARRVYLDVLKNAEVTKLNRGDTKSVRLMFEITPELLKLAGPLAPPLNSDRPPTSKSPQSN